MESLPSLSFARSSLSSSFFSLAPSIVLSNRARLRDFRVVPA
jgi:hypothetical protein